MTALDVLAGRARWALEQGDVLERLAALPDESVNCVISSPPYWGLRDYGVKGQIGLEATPDLFVARMVEVFAEVRRVLRSDGTLWLNLGDSYATNPGNGRGGETVEGGIPHRTAADKTRAGLKPKDLCGIPWRVAFALQADGWWLRSDIIWGKPNPMPESVTDRPTRAHEYLFLLTKSARYAYDADAIREEVQPDPRNELWGTTTTTRFNDHAADLEQGMHQKKPSGFVAMSNPLDRNKRTVWTIATEPFSFDRVSRAGGGDIGRTTSPDCPVHGDRPTPASTARRGEQPDASGSDRTASTGARPEQSRLDALAPTETPHGADSSPGSSGSPDPGCGSPATPRSTGSRRTDPAPSTSPRATRAEGSPGCTGDTGPEPDDGATSRRIDENNNAEEKDGSERVSGPSERSFDRSSDKCTCRSIDHFAVMPTALVEPCVLAGCPAKTCPLCGAPWERVTKRTAVPLQETYNGAINQPATVANRPTARWDAGTGKPSRVEVETLGWEPTCACSDCTGRGDGRHRWMDGADICEWCGVAYEDRFVAEPVPGVVLDPFCGSGTVVMEALRHGRRGIGFDLSPTYLEMASRRIFLDCPMFNQEVAG